MMKDIRKKLLRGSVWIAAGRVSVILIGLLSTLVLARALSPDDFGLVALSGTIIAMVMAFTELPINAALVQAAEPGSDDYDSAFTLSLARSLIIGILVWIVAWPIARIYGDMRLIPLLVVSGATTIVTGLGNPKIVVFARSLLFHQDFIASVVQKMAGFLAAMAVAYFYHSYWALVIGSSVAQLSGVLLSYLMAPYRPRFSSVKIGNILSFSVWVSLAHMVNSINKNFDTLMIGYLLGRPTLGVYTVAQNLAVQPIAEATNPISNTLFPTYARLNDDPARLQKAYLLSQGALCAVAFPSGFGFATVARPFVELAMGTKWLAAVPLIQVLAVAIALQSVNLASSPLALARDETRRLFLRDLVGFSTRIPLMIGGMAIGGVMGVVYARALSTVVRTGAGLMLVRGLIGTPIRLQLAVASRPLGCTLLMVAAILLTGALVPVGTGAVALAAEIALKVAVGGIVYLGVTLFWWRAAGHPDGLERECHAILVRFSRRWTRHLQSEPV